ncbi:PIN domain-containing protein [Candidatus Roizmanbacteria bacterium]|nr:PIN domain-containing protein [Candidatus Roizmanbacteria bacterium]
MNLPKYCLDTHPLIWYFSGQKTLSTKAKKTLDGIFSNKPICYIPSIVLLESYHLSLKRPKFNFSKFFQSLRIPNIIIVPLDKIVLTSCFNLPKNLDIHNRIICATATTTKSILVTKDETIHKLQSIKYIW